MVNNYKVFPRTEEHYTHENGYIYEHYKRRNFYAPEKRW